MLSNGKDVFWPVDTADTVYFCSSQGYSLSSIINLIKKKFGEDIDFSDIDIGAEHINTDCISYDRYDPGDYTDFIVVTRVRQ